MNTKPEQVELHHLHNSDPLIETHHLDIGTRDADDQGYYKSDGTNRGLGWGLTEDRTLTIYMTTNGDDIAVPDELPDLLPWLYDLGDEPDPVWERIETGISRLREAIHEISRLDALYDLPINAWAEWYIGICQLADSAIGTYEPDREELLPPVLWEIRQHELGITDDED